MPIDARPGEDHVSKLTLTTFSGHMTTNGGRKIITFRWADTDGDSPGPLAARRELRTGNRTSFSEATVRYSEGSAKSRERRISCGANAREDAAFPAGASLLRSPGASKLPEPPIRGRGRTPRTRQTASASAAEDRKTSLTITASSTIEEVAQVVAEALDEAGIRAVLTGGACAAIHTAGEYQSEDLDFILQSAPSQGELDEVMGRIGYRREGEQYFHSETRFFVDFPSGPLGIGRDLSITPVRVRVGSQGSIRALSPTDSCRDRLSAFIHWNDRQSLDAAVKIALHNPIGIKKIQTWSASEGATERFEEFSREVARARQRGRRTS